MRSIMGNVLPGLAGTTVMHMCCAMTISSYFPEGRGLWGSALRPVRSRRTAISASSWSIASICRMRVAHASLPQSWTSASREVSSWVLRMTICVDFLIAAARRISSIHRSASLGAEMRRYGSITRRPANRWSTPIELSTSCSERADKTIRPS
jgi:hypothetical protein